MTDFLARVRALPKPTIPAPIVSFVPKAPPMHAPMRDVCEVIADMGEWAGDVHELPDLGALHVEL